MPTTSLPLYGTMHAGRRAHRLSSLMWLPLLCAWLLMMFTIGQTENEDLRPLLPEQLLRNSKIFLRLSVLAIMATILEQHELIVPVEFTLNSASNDSDNVRTRKTVLN